MLHCSCCQTELVITHYDRYETIDEHVSLSQPSVKPGYQCTNEYCVANNLGVTWIEDGDFFLDPPLGVKSSVAKKILEKVALENVLEAIGSWSRDHQLQKLYSEKNKKSVSLLNWKIDFDPPYPQKGSSIFQEILRFKNWKIDIWKKEDLGFVKVTPFWVMVKFSVSQFHRAYAGFETSDNDLKSCYQEIVGLTTWGTKDVRFYAKFASVWLKIFYPLKCRKVLKKYKEVYKETIEIDI